MPKIQEVKRCRKSPGQCSKCQKKINVGDPYRYWESRVTAGKAYISRKTVRCTDSVCRPMPSEMTQSAFWGPVFALQEQGFDGSDMDELEASRDSVVEELNNIKSEQEDKLSNMPEGLQQGSTGEMIQERIDALESAIGDLESVDISWDPGEKGAEETDEEFENASAESLVERCAEITEEMNQILSNISCS